MLKDLSDYIRSIPDFPKPGIIFRDIVPLIEDSEGLRQTISTLKDGIKDWGKIDKIAAPEARGFVFASPLALELGAGLVLLRKPHKLPFKTISVDYELEYGTNTIEMHTDSILPNERILLIDDLLATGGTINACRKLVEKAGGIAVGAAFVIELVDLNGRKNLNGLPVFAPVQFKGE